MIDFKELLKNIFIFKQPEKSETFILKETPAEKEEIQREKDIKNVYEPKKPKNEDMLLNQVGSKSHNVKVSKEAKKELGKASKKEEEKPDISSKLNENLEHIKNVYTIPDNGDVVLREFDIVVRGKVIPAFIVFIDGMADRTVINNNILQPLMLLSNLDIKSDETDLAEYIRSHILPQNQLQEVREHQKVVDEVNFGGCGIYIDGMSSAFAADVKGFEHRGVDRPNAELVIRGPQEGFNELLRVNTALIRKRLKDENLIVENILIGKRSKTPCSMLFIKDIANDSLVEEVRRRLESIEVDYIFDSGELEQYIEDSSIIPAPLILATERPDRVSYMLTEGRVAIIMNGSPFALVVPVTDTDLIHSAEDSNVRYPYANLLRAVRILGVLTSLLLPGLYVAITNFHHEMIPTDLLFAIEASREKVPFPSVVEILIMEVAFELIREAGIRIPGPIGPTLGIIGALILGQAAVAANIVSPILIIIVAVTGIGSFAVPNFSLGFSFRILRFGYIFLGALAGLLGITGGLFTQALWLANAKSFGVPFLAPFAPRTAGSMANQFLRAPIWKQENQPDYFNSKNKFRQSKISRAWIKRGKGDENNGK